MQGLPRKNSKKVFFFARSPAAAAQKAGPRGQGRLETQKEPDAPPPGPKIRRCVFHAAVVYWLKTRRYRSFFQKDALLSPAPAVASRISFSSP